MRLKFYAPAVVWGAFVLFLGGRSDVPAVDTDLPVDKAAHFVLYGILGLLAAFGWLKAGRRPAWFWPVLASLLVGVADELNQRTVATRAPEVLDWVADAIGVGAGFGLLAGREWVRKRSQTA